MREKNTGLGVKILRATIIIAVSIVAPQFPFVALKYYLKKKYGKTYSHQQLANSVNYLKRRKYLAYSNGKFAVTKIGHEILREAYEKDIKIPKVAWDGKWRFVSFDIPEEQRQARHAMLYKLKELGFYHFQRSLFVIPYPCQKEIEILARMLKIVPHVHIFVAERFPSDRKLAKSFGVY